VFVGSSTALAIVHQYQLASYSGRTTGVVVDFQVRRGPSSRASNPSLAPVVAFTTANGEPVQFTSTLASTPPRFSIGQQVAIAYDPVNPSQATIDGFWDAWFFSLVTAGAGLFFFLLGLAIRKPRPGQG
jgi:hypothetical protein